MKAIIFSLTLFASGLASAIPSNLGEVDLKDCECKTCLIENGVCIRTQTNGERYVPDKSSSKPKPGKKGSAASASKT